MTGVATPLPSSQGSSRCATVRILVIEPFCCRSEKDPKGFGSRAAPEAKLPAKVKAASEEDRKWKLEPREVSEWLDWVNAQKQAAGVTGELE